MHPFSGAIADGYVWGRGAIDMKDMVGDDARGRPPAPTRARAGPRPRVHVPADEEAGGTWGASFLVDKQPELFEGVTEAIGEVGGFS